MASLAALGGALTSHHHHNQQQQAHVENAMNSTSSAFTPCRPGSVRSSMSDDVDDDDDEDDDDDVMQGLDEDDDDDELDDVDDEEDGGRMLMTPATLADARRMYASGKSAATNAAAMTTHFASSAVASSPTTTANSTSAAQLIDMSAYEDYLKPIYRDGDVVLEVECGKNQAMLYLSRLCQGSKGPCIYFNDMWLTPNEFQFVSGRETAKDWKRSIRHHGKSMKLLLSKGILAVHPPICDCDGCRISSPVNRGRLAEKRGYYPPYLDLRNNAGSGDGKRTSVLASVPLPTASSTLVPLQETSTTCPKSRLHPTTTSTTTTAPISANYFTAPSCAPVTTAPPAAVTQTTSTINWTRNMESASNKRKSDLSHKSPEPIEKRRESRLTSIIDQLLNNRTKGLKSEEIKSTSSPTILNNNNNNTSNNKTELCPPASAAAAPPVALAENDSNSDDSGNDSRPLESISSRDSGVTSSASPATCEATSAETSANEEAPPCERPLVNGTCFSSNSKIAEHCDVTGKRRRSTHLAAPSVTPRPVKPPVTPEVTPAVNATCKEWKSVEGSVVTCTSAVRKKKRSNGCSRVACSGGGSGSGTCSGVGGRAPKATESQLAALEHAQLPLPVSTHYSAEQHSSAATVVGAWRTSNFVQRPNDGAAGCTTVGMPTEGFLVDPTKVKTERLSPSTTINSNNTNSLPLGLGLGLGLGGFAFPALGIDTSSPSPAAASSRRSPASRINSPAGSLSRLGASPTPAPPPPAFPGSAPHTPPPSFSLHDRFSPSSNSCGTPILKQMEQMMTRNYSDFMRSLAAKYNNNNSAECYNYPHLNGLMRNFDGRFPFKTTTPPLTGPPRDESTRKSENHSAPPVLGSVGALSPLSPLGGVVDLSSTQALLSMVRSASAQSASQLENYLKGVLKRPLEQEVNSNNSNNNNNNNNGSRSGACTPRADPLDLSVPSKRSRTNEEGRKSRAELSSSLKTDSDGSDVSPTMSPRSNGSGSDSRAWPGVLLDGKLSALEPQPLRRSGLSSSSSSASSPSHMTKNNSQMALACGSLCADRACAEGSEAAIVAKWTVEDVCEFVASIDACTEYVPSFREQAIDGAALPLLSEDHLTNNMNLKLGPALKFRAILAKKIGHCAVCMHCIHCHGLSADSSATAMTSSTVNADNNSKMSEVS